MPDPVNVDRAEIARFESAASRWWDPEGEIRTLHEINPVRLAYVERAGSLAGRAIVDVGCGGGVLAEAMARAGAQVVGLDLAEELLRVAELHALEANVPVTYLREAAEQHAGSHASAYDVVTCMEMLEHVPDPASTIAACAALAKPGGHVVVSTINRNPKSYLFAIVGAEYLLRLLPRGTHDWGRFLKPAEVARHARRAGLDLDEVAGMTYNPLSRTYRIESDTSVNYLAAFRRPAVAS